MVAPRSGAAPAAEGGRTARASARGAALAAAAFASVAAFAVSPWLFCSLMLSVDTSVSGVGDSGCEEFNQEFDLTIPIASFGCQLGRRQSGSLEQIAACLERLRLALNRLICNDEHNFAVVDASRRRARLLDCIHISEPILPV